MKGIKQDSRGRMLFITDRGLSVYDGVQFTNYTREDGLANPLVNDIIEIGHDSFLIATNSTVLNTLFRGRLGKFASPDTLLPVINRFLKSTDGSLYVTADNGLFRIEDHEFVNLPMLNSQGVDIGKNLDRVTEWNNYFLIIPWSPLQHEKLIIYDKRKEKVAGILTDQSVAQTSVTPSGELLIGFGNERKALDLTALKQGHIVLNPIHGLINAEEWRNMNLYFDDNDKTWLYRENSVAEFTSEQEFKPITFSQNSAANNFSDLFVDKEGIIWLATSGNGVIKIPGTNVEIIKDLSPGIRNQFSAICSQKDTTWLFNKTNQSFYRVCDMKTTLFPLSSKSHVSHIYISGSTIYFTEEQALYAITDKNIVSSYHHPVLIPFDIPVIQTGSGISDPYGTIIQTVQQNDSTFYLAIVRDLNVIAMQKLDELADQLVIDSKKHLWLATRDNHLLKYTLHPESPKQYLALAEDHSNEIDDIGPRALAVDTSGTVWIGTRFNGIYMLLRIQNNNDSVRHFTTHEGLSENFIQHLYCDAENVLWVGSEAGLDKISMHDGEYVIDNITKSRNMVLEVSQIVNVHKDIIWALSAGGEILQVRNDPAYPISAAPSLFITSLVVNDVKYEKTETVFTNDQNHISCAC